MYFQVLTLLACLLGCLLPGPTAAASTVLVEAESFDDPGGWKLDTQFLHVMGSPYLLAHGLGRPVDDATTTVELPEAGTYRVWVRTKDWAAAFGESLGEDGAPGRFELHIAGQRIDQTFGAENAQWHWQDGGAIELEAGEQELRLHDLTGFDGRCDAILLTTDQELVPDNTSAMLPAWRRTMLGQPEDPEPADYDLVVVGGGYAGMGAAVSAARLGLRVALIQNRPVLGGNGSSEVRVWGQGVFPGRLYPLGDIVREFSYTPNASPWHNRFAQQGDERMQQVIDGEDNIDLYLLHHAFGVDMTDARGEDARRIASVDALDCRTGTIRRFRAPLFVDATGHGFVGMWAGADINMEDGERMGMSNMWTWELADSPQTFPTTPWALDLDEGDFPYPRRGHAEWFWESGFDKHPLDDLELIRDWNLCAAYGAWNAIKNKGAYAENEPETAHRNARMTWLAYVGGTRETQQILGDVILTQEDITSQREWDDAAVLSTWSIDLHYPNRRYLRGFEDNPFIAYADHARAPQNRATGYEVPYRCFYSRNVENLFTAGRCISVTHEALGTVRVMNTLGMVGVTVGRAASICIEHDCLPRDVYEDHLPTLRSLLDLPGATRRAGAGEPYVDAEGEPVVPADPGP